MLRVGIIGAGTISEFHIRALKKLPGVAVSAICDVVTARARMLGDRYDISVVAPSADELLSLEGIDAVTIGVWNAAHADLAVAALAAGKHVFCEKPMARNGDEAARMLAAEQRAQKLLMIGLVRRFDLRCEIAADLIADGVLGEIYYIRAGYLRRDGRPGGWFTSKEKSGGGALIDIGIHSLDLALHLAELAPPLTVSGYTKSLPNIMDGIVGTEKYQSRDAADVRDVEDHAFASLRFDEGCLVTLEACWAQHRERDYQYLDLYGSSGGLVVDPQLQLSRNAGRALSDTRYPIAAGTDPLQDMFDREMAHFAACLNEGRQCRSPASEGLQLMRIIDAIYESAASGSEVRLEA
jgi:predicted dehydrogenase